MRMTISHRYQQKYDISEKIVICTFAIYSNLLFPFSRVNNPVVERKQIGGN